MRYTIVASLVSVSQRQLEDGTFEEVKTAKTVFANSYTMGASAYMAAKSAGLHADAELQLRSCDYGGEQECVLEGAVYDVERSQDSGEFTLLTLKRRLHDA